VPGCAADTNSGGQVSLCDLLDSNLDVVFDRGSIYWRHDETAMWTYFLISIICIYLTSCVSDNIVAMVHNAPRAANKGKMQLFCVYATLALIVYLIYYQDISSLLLTREDSDLTTHLFAYAVALTLAQHTNPDDDMHGNRISLLTALIALLTLRVHYSFDNPYMLVLCILFGVRSVFKFLAVTVLQTSVGAHALMLADFFVFCSMLDNGLMVRTHSLSLSSLCAALRVARGAADLRARDRPTAPTSSAAQPRRSCSCSCARSRRRSSSRTSSATSCSRSAARTAGRRRPRGPRCRQHRRSRCPP